MSPLPQSVREIDLLRWVAAHPNAAFDPGMVVSVTHATDWQWQAVVHQMEELARQTYIRKIKQEPTGVTYWSFTSRGESYLRALERAETANQEVAVRDSFPTQAPSIPAAAPPADLTLTPPTIAKVFAAAAIALKATTRLTFTITNPNPKAELTDIGFVDVLPTGLLVSDPNGLVGSWAKGELTARPGSDRIELSGGTLTPSESCTFQLLVAGVTEGTKSNVTTNVTSKEGGNGGAAAATIVVESTGAFPRSPDQKNSSDWMDQATIDRFSDGLRAVLTRADQIRSSRGRPAVSTMHLLMALVDQPGSQLSELLRNAGVSLDSLIPPTEDVSAEGPPEDVVSSGPWRFPRITGNVRMALVRARDKAADESSPTIDDSYLLYGLLSLSETDNFFIRELSKRGISEDQVRLAHDKGQAAQAALAGYKSDDPSGADLLSITREVNALASVLAAKEVGPPLSLGLFGDWGTGKSFFMRRLENRIRELTIDAKQAHGDSQYCQDIVQLTFNAWNYIDKDLWASLASEIFEGLAAALASRRGDDSQQGRARALAAASSSPAVVAETERQKSEAEARLKESEEQLAELQRSQRNIKLRLSAREIINQAARFAIKDEDVRKQATEAAEQIGISQGIAAIGEIQTQILELDSIWTEILFTMRNNKNLWVWAVALLVAFGVTWGVRHVAQDYIGRDFIKVVVDALTALSSFLLAFLVSSRKLLTLARRIRASRQDLVDKTQQAIKEKIDQTRASIEKEAETVKTLSQQLENMRADRQLVDFIRERYESSDYRNHLGTIARVRADFRHLSTLLRDVQEESEKDLADMKTRQKQSDKDRLLFPRIDRIILYIDDLDRCPEKNVVEVLQAVHLLLAFPLFVVVVGVDPRWLLHSLRQRSDVFQMKVNSNDDVQGLEEDSHWQSTPLNYLEKIFQIPFTLRALSKSGFEKLVDAFATQIGKTAERAESSGGQSPTVPVAKPAYQQSATPEPVSHRVPTSGALQPSPQEAGSSTVSTQRPTLEQRMTELTQQAASERGVAQPVSEPIDRHPEHLHIEERERVFMKTLYEFIPSPRAGKRFINIYRLLRASVEDRERPRFIGNDAEGEYQCALMLLAILTGYPTEATAILEALITKRPKGTWGKFIESTKNSYTKNSTTKGFSARSVPKQIGTIASSPEQRSTSTYQASDAERWTDLFSKLERIKSNLNDRECTGFISWAPRVARYSFESGRVLSQQRE